MDDKDRARFSKEGTSSFLNPKPSAIARRKRMEILRFKKLSYTTDLPQSDSNVTQISLHLKRARPTAIEPGCDLDPEDVGTPSPKLQKEEGSNCVQTKGKELAESTEHSCHSPTKLLEDCRTDLFSLDAARTTPAQMAPVHMVKASEQAANNSQNSELQSPCSATKDDVSLHQADVSLHSHKKVDSSAILEVASSTAQSKACTSYSFSNQGCPPSGMLLLCGQRREMEDRAAIVPSFAHLRCDLAGSCSCKGKEGGKSTNVLHFFAVYDGHGGSQASQFCMERLHLVLAEELATLCVLQDANQDILPCDWKSVMASSFSRMDKEMGGFYWNRGFQDVGSSATHSGGSIAPECVRTTAVVAVVSSCQIVVASCGHSRAVLSRSGKAVPLSLAHKPEREDETNRLEAAGGQVIFWDSHQVGGLLALSRATDVGYHHLKHFVVSEPEVMCIQRSEEDECLILASDGLWDVINDDTTCEIARKCLASSRSTREYGMHDFGEDRASIAAAAILVKVAFGRGSKDNISVVVIDLKN